MIAELFFLSDRSDPAVVAIIWKPDKIYRNNHPPFLINCYLYALQTYRTHSSKLRLLLVTKIKDVKKGKEVIESICCPFYRSLR